MWTTHTGCMHTRLHQRVAGSLTAPALRHTPSEITTTTARTDWCSAELAMQLGRISAGPLVGYGQDRTPSLCAPRQTPRDCPGCLDMHLLSETCIHFRTILMSTVIPVHTRAAAHGQSTVLGWCVLHRGDAGPAATQNPLHRVITFRSRVGVAPRLYPRAPTGRDYD